jgi:hypothetical protein
MKKISLGLFVLLLFTVSVNAQDVSEKLAKVSKALQEKVREEEPSWIHSSITPIEGSKNVIIEQWESSGVATRVSVTEYDAQRDAVLALKEFKSHLRTQEDAAAARGKPDFHLVREDLPELGDGGFTWDIRGSEAVAFRKQNFLVFVNIARPEGYNDVRLSKEFARRAADVLLQP